MPDASTSALHPAFPRPKVLPLRQRSDVIHRVLKKRLETVLPAAMRENGFDAWLVLCQEDNWDPIHDTFCPMDPWRPILQMLIFFNRGPERGDVVLRENTAFTMELSVEKSVPEWGKENFRMGVEEDVLFAGGQCRLIHGRQKAFYLC